MGEINNPSDERMEDSSEKLEESSAIATTEDVESKFDEIIDAIPEDKRNQALHTIQEIRETFVGLVDRSPSKLSPEVVRLLTESADKDNDNKFRYLTQKQQNEAEAQQRADALKEKEHDLKRQKHTDNFTILKPVIWIVLLVVVGSTIAGIWLCVIGKEGIGAAILSGIWGAVFGYLAGFGTSNFFKS